MQSVPIEKCTWKERIFVDSVVTVLDFSFSVGFGSVLEEKPTVSISVFQPLRVGQSMREEMRGSGRDIVCTRSTRLSVETEAYKIG